MWFIDGTHSITRENPTFQKSPEEWKGSVYVISFLLPSFYEVSSRALFLVTTRFSPFALSRRGLERKENRGAINQPAADHPLSQSVGGGSVNVLHTQLP